MAATRVEGAARHPAPAPPPQPPRRVWTAAVTPETLALLDRANLADEPGAADDARHAFLHRFLEFQLDNVRAVQRREQDGVELVARIRPLCDAPAPAIVVVPPPRPRHRDAHVTEDAQQPQPTPQRRTAPDDRPRHKRHRQQPSPPPVPRAPQPPPQQLLPLTTERLTLVRHAPGLERGAAAEGIFAKGKLSRTVEVASEPPQQPPMRHSKRSAPVASPVTRSHALRQRQPPPAPLPLPPQTQTQTQTQPPSRSPSLSPVPIEYVDRTSSRPPPVAVAVAPLPPWNDHERDFHSVLDLIDTSFAGAAAAFRAPYSEHDRVVPSAHELGFFDDGSSPPLASGYLDDHVTFSRMFSPAIARVPTAASTLLAQLKTRASGGVPFPFGSPLVAAAAAAATASGTGPSEASIPAHGMYSPLVVGRPPAYGWYDEIDDAAQGFVWRPRLPY